MTTPAWAEAEASCTNSYVVIDTLEFQHPGITNGVSQIALRFVMDVRPRVMGVELGALFNPGEMVEFLPTALRCETADYAEGRVPSARLTIDNVAQELMAHLERAVGFRADLKVIIRRYRDDDLTGPIYGPVEFVLRDVQASGSTVTGTATIADFGEAKVPSLVYSLAAFPGLQG